MGVLSVLGFVRRAKDDPIGVAQLPTIFSVAGKNFHIAPGFEVFQQLGYSPWAKGLDRSIGLGIPYDFAQGFQTWPAPAVGVCENAQGQQQPNMSWVKAGVKQGSCGNDG